MGNPRVRCGLPGWFRPRKCRMGYVSQPQFLACLKRLTVVCGTARERLEGDTSPNVAPADYA